MSTIGIDALGASQGMELAKQNQRRDDEWVRSQKRADIQDQVAQYGLEDLQRTRADAARERAAVAGSDGTVKGAADAATAARLASGSLEGAAKAKGIKVQDAIKDFEARQTQFMAEIEPIRQRITKMQMQGQLDRQPATEMLADQETQNRLRSQHEALIGRAWQVLNTDRAAGLKMISDSPVLFEGQSVVDVRRSPDGNLVMFIGNDGKPIKDKDGNPVIRTKQYLDDAAAKVSDPGKVYEVEPGKALVHVNATGTKTKEVYKAPDKPVVGKYIETPSGSILDTHTGITKPGIGGSTSPAMAAKRDAHVKTADSMVREALGGSLNMGLPSEDAQKLYPQIMERVGKKIDAGVPPEKAAKDSLDEVQRELKLGASGTAATGPVDWKQFAPQGGSTPKIPSSTELPFVL